MSNEEQNNIKTEVLFKFKDEHERMLTLVVILLSIVAGFLPALVVWFLQKDKLSASAQQVILDLLNFELTVLICAVVAGFPLFGGFIGSLLLPVIWVWNLIICIFMLSATSKKQHYKIPFMLELIK